MIDVWRCRVLDMWTQSTLFAPSLLHKNQPTISLSKVPSTMLEGPKIDGFADGKVYNDDRGMGVAPTAGSMQ